MSASPIAIVVVPCYNEAQRLQTQVFSDFAKQHPSIKLLFVNDGSRDETLKILQDLVKSHPQQMQVISLPQNQGKAEAVRQGLCAAMSEQPQFVAYWDADLATPLDELPAFLAAMEQHPLCDLVMGSRVKLLGRTIERNPLRHYLGRIFATAASMTLRLAVYDTQCGAKMLRVNPRMREIIRTAFASRWIFDVELLARMGAQDASQTLEQRVIEVPLQCWRDIKGSKVKPWDFFKAIKELLVIKHRYGQGPRHV